MMGAVFHWFSATTSSSEEKFHAEVASSVVGLKSELMYSSRLPDDRTVRSLLLLLLLLVDVLSVSRGELMAGLGRQYASLSKHLRVRLLR